MIKKNLEYWIVVLSISFISFMLGSIIDLPFKTNESTQLDTITDLFTIIAGISTMFLAFSALKAMNDWKKQLQYNHKKEVLEKMHLNLVNYCHFTLKFLILSEEKLREVKSIFPRRTSLPNYKKSRFENRRSQLQSNRFSV